MLLISQRTWMRQRSSVNKNLGVRCTVKCPGDELDFCGGSNHFSVYKIRGQEHSCVCENLKNTNHSTKECEISPVDLQFRCHNQAAKDDGKKIETNCSEIPLTWIQSLHNCLESGANFKISNKSGESCSIESGAVNMNHSLYNFVKLSFVWNTKPNTKDDYKCLGVRLEENKVFKLLPFNCTEKRKVLCHKVLDEDFYVSDANNTWVKAANNCIDGWKLSGKDLFNSCRSDTCNSSKANDVLRNVKIKPPFLWIDGYAVRSPIMEYYECISLTDVNSTANALTKKKKLVNNGVGKCALFFIQDGYLKNEDFILLQSDTCYCLPLATEQLWKAQIMKMQMISTKTCNIRCDEDKFDRCGGKNDIFSAYKLKEIGLPMSDEIGGNCFYTYGTSKAVKRSSCKETFKVKCEEVIHTDGNRYIDVACFEHMLNWYDARRTCNQSGKYLQLLNYQCGNIDEFQAVQLWHNMFIKERIDWNTDNVTDKDRKNGYKCLAMKLTTDSNYILIAENCDNAYHSLCQKDVSDTDGIPKKKEKKTVDSKVSMYVGIAVSLTILLIVVVVLAICIRRKTRYMPKEVPTAPDVYYSTVTGDQIHENQSHTPDGANKDQSDANLMISAKQSNTYTDNDQQEIHKMGSTYDQAGLPDSNEYDVSSTSQKYRSHVDEDVCYYDHNRDFDTVYDETDTHGLIQRNEISEIYNHTREIIDDYDVSHAFRQQGETHNEPVYFK